MFKSVIEQVCVCVCARVRVLVMSNGERVVLALGGAGTVGSGLVKALLDRGKNKPAPKAEFTLHSKHSGSLLSTSVLIQH